MKTHSEEKPYYCTFCTKSFTYNDNLKNHLRTHSRFKKSYSCILCPKSFIDHGKLKEQIRIHSLYSLYKTLFTGNTCEHIWKKYRCTLCRKSFTQGGNLKIHT